MNEWMNGRASIDRGRRRANSKAWWHGWTFVSLVVDAYSRDLVVQANNERTISELVVGEDDKGRRIDALERHAQQPERPGGLRLRVFVGVVCWCAVRIVVFDLIRFDCDRQNCALRFDSLTMGNHKIGIWLTKVS
jgi:hypothetical protein